MSKNFFHGQQIGSSVQHVRGERVPESVYRKTFALGCPGQPRADRALYLAPGDAGPAA